MSYDPAQPANNSALSSQVMRNQFTGIKAIIDAMGSITGAVVDGVNTLPAGSQAGVTLSLIGDTLHFTFEIPQGQEGLVGAQGPPFSTAVVDGVSTLNPGEPATVEVSYDGSLVHFVFGIPRGNDGQPGEPGQPGATGGPGPEGPQGPPFANAVVDGVTTLDPNDSATVGVFFDGTNVRFSFGIPRGQSGQNGEVTSADLTNAFNGTSNNSNAVSTLGVGVSDPPTQSDVQTIANKLDDLINALRR